MEREPRILIVGRGAVASAVERLCIAESRKYTYFPWEGGHVPDVAIHVGSGREFGDLLQFCSSAGRNIPILQCSSPIEPHKTPVRSAVFDVPNAALPLLLFLEFAYQLSRHVLVSDLGSHNWRLEESHQESKQRVSSTAETIAKHLQIPIEHVIKDRSRPEPHAYHHLKGVAAGVEMDLSFKVEGRRPYAEGMIYLARRLHGRGKFQKLEPRWYAATELLTTFW